MPAKRQVFTSCQVMRRKYVTRFDLDMGTGETEERGGEWVTEYCNAPLFKDSERAVGKCRSCAEGWTHPHNLPA